MHWKDLVTEQPKLAELGRQRLEGPGVVLVATIRRDGSPRVSPVEPLFWRGDLWLSMLWGSRKANDVELDRRILVHSIVTGREGTSGEYKVRGHAVPEMDAGVQQGFAEAIHAHAGWRPEPGKFHLFRVDVDDVTFIRYDEATGDQFTTRWPRRVEYVRRGTSATTVGASERYTDLLV